jgi:hypothetical protein
MKNPYPTRCPRALSLPPREQPPPWAVRLPFSVEIKSTNMFLLILNYSQKHPIFRQASCLTISKKDLFL